MNNYDPFGFGKNMTEEVMTRERSSGPSFSAIKKFSKMKTNPSELSNQLQDSTQTPIEQTTPVLSPTISVSGKNSLILPDMINPDKKSEDTMSKVQLINSKQLGQEGAQAIVPAKSTLEKAIDDVKLVDNLKNKDKSIDGNEDSLKNTILSAISDISDKTFGQQAQMPARTANFANISGPNVQDTMADIRQRVLANIASRRM